MPSVRLRSCPLAFLLISSVAVAIVALSISPNDEYQVQTSRPTPDHYSLFQKRLSSNGNCTELYRIKDRNKDPLSESVQE